MAYITVVLHRGRGRSHAIEADRLYRDLATLLALLNPLPVDSASRDIATG
jgi:hypothetical protein